MLKTIGIAVALATALSSQVTQPADQSLPRKDALQTWLAATVQHRPGTPDAAAALAARWTAADFERLLPGLLYYLRIVREQETRNHSRASCGSCQVSQNERDRLLRETKSRTTRAEQALIDSLPRPERLNDLILRGVILHTDAEMFFPKAAAVPGARSPSTNVLKAPGEIVRSADGQYAGAATGAPHWYMTRALLQFITPEPALDPGTRRWYLAASAFLAASSDFANLSPHLEAAQALFPEDAMVAFDLGWQSEAHATPRLQTHLRALVAAADPQRHLAGRMLCLSGRIPCDSDGNPYGIKSERNSLVDAERHFTRAVTLDPGLTEAHVRLAHVRTLLGRHAEAETALRNLPPSSDADVTFYAALVHGIALDTLDRLDEAAAAYQRALALFPNAQSANLAMSVVQQRRGDTSRSVEFAKRAVEEPANDAAALDPFLHYRYGRGRNVSEDWAAFYAALASQ